MEPGLKGLDFYARKVAISHRAAVKSIMISAKHSFIYLSLSDNW